MTALVTALRNLAAYLADRAMTPRVVCGICRERVTGPEHVHVEINHAGDRL